MCPTLLPRSLATEVGVQPLQKKLGSTGSSGFLNLDGKSWDGTPSWWEGKARKEEGKNKRTSVGGRGMRYKDGMEE